MQALLSGQRLFFEGDVPFLWWKYIQIHSTNGNFRVFMICCNLSGPSLRGVRKTAVGMKKIAPGLVPNHSNPTMRIDHHATPCRVDYTSVK